MSLPISNKLKELRDILGMNQFEFSQFINIKQPTLSAYERNISNPSLDVLIMICEKCNVSLDWLCGIKNPTHFSTGADFINTFLKIKEIPGFNYDITSGDSGDLKEGVSHTLSLTFTGEFGYQQLLENKKDFNVNDFFIFLEEFDQLEKKLNTLGDNELSENYRKMWLEKKLQEYANYKIIGEE